MNGTRQPHNSQAMLVITLVLCSFHPTPARGAFNPNNYYAFQGLHVLQVVTSGIDQGPPDEPVSPGHHGSVAIATATDWRLFRVLVRPGWLTQRYKLDTILLDWDGNGTWDDTAQDQSVLSHMYPEPTNGVSTTYQARVGLFVVDLQADSIPYCCATTSYTIPITVLAAPRVWTTPEGDALVQLRNEDCLNKVPFLMVEGIDVTNETSLDTYYNWSGGLIDELNAAGYAVFFLNFKDATRALDLNAQVVRQALAKVHELCPNNEIAVCGMSMGGVLTRHALAEDEDQGAEHHAGLFISFDSPQKGAHANAGLQSWLKMQDSSKPEVARLQERLNTAASRQLLYHNAYGNNDVEHFTYYDSLLARLNGDGFPNKSLNVALSNGTTRAAWGSGYEADFILSFKIEVGSGLPLTSDLIQTAQRDWRAGSLQINLAQVSYGWIYPPWWLEILPGIQDPIGRWEIGIGLEPVFIPTESAFALQEPVFYSSDGDLDLVHSGHTQFDETFAQPDPQALPRALRHNAISAASRSKIYEWLSRSSEMVVNYSLGEGGTVGPEMFAVSILRGRAITVQPKTITTSDGRLITYVFDQWADGSAANPRTFFSSHDAVQTAIMKAQLATSSSAATWGSNVRRLSEATDPVGPTIHGVYESGGNVWHIRNRRGAGWEQGRRLSWGGASGASITTQSFGGGDLIQVHVAWMIDQHFVFLSSGVPLDNGLTWQQPKVFWSGYGRDLTLLDANCAGSGHVEGCWPSLLWADGNPDWYPEALGVWYRKQPQHSTGGGAFLVPGTEGVVSQPVGAPADCGPLGVQHADHHLAFVRGGKVWVETFRDPDYLNLTTPPQQIVPAFDVTTQGWTAARPSIVSNGSDVMVAWEETQGTLSRIAFRQRSGVDAWSPAVYLWFHGAHVASKPVLGIDHSRGVLNLLWQCSDHIAHVSRLLSGGVWTSQLDLAGRSPSIVASSANRATAMWTVGAVAPYSMVVPGNDLSDVVPPGAISVEPDVVTPNSIYFNWSATADDGVLPASGPAQRFDFRWSPTAISDETVWSYVPPVAGTPTPGPFGTLHQMTVANLTPSTVYHFSLRAEDDRPNLGALPPDLQVQTTCGGYGGGGEYSAHQVTGGGEGGAMLASGSSVGSPGSPLVVETRRLEGNGWHVRLRLATEADGLDSSSAAITVDRERPDGGRDALGEFAPGETENVLGLCALRERGRLAVPGFTGIEQVMARVRREGQDYSLADAQHSRLGSMGATFLAKGGSPELVAGDVIDLTYALSSGQLEDPASWYVLVRRQGTAPPTPFSRRRGQGAPIPESYALHQNRPNPSAGATTILFDLPVETTVRLEIFDAQGRLVRTLAGGTFPAGFHNLGWDQRTDGGRALGAGVYLYRIQAGSFRDQKKMVLLAK